MSDFTWSEAKQLQNQRFVISAQKYGKDWWNKEKKRKPYVAKRLIQTAMFAKRASLVPNFSGANATWFQSITLVTGQNRM